MKVLTWIGEGCGNWMRDVQRMLEWLNGVHCDLGRDKLELAL